ncbi:MAG: hypothetical protein F9K40_21805, partial [Kofleriaceae bacterium]
MAWRCLLDGEVRSRAIGAIGDIVGAAPGEDRTTHGLEGAAGRACLLAYAGQAKGDEAMLERGNELLESSVGALADGFGAPGLWGGLADVRFVLAHLVAGEEGGEALAVIDDALVEVVGGASERIDLIGGLSGIGVAALEDPARGRGTELAARVLDAIERSAHRDADGVTWFTPPQLLPDWQRDICPDGHWNLGLAHGIPGVIGFLAAMVTSEVEAARALSLLERAVP